MLSMYKEYRPSTIVHYEQYIHYNEIKNVEDRIMKNVTTSSEINNK